MFDREDYQYTDTCPQMKCYSKLRVDVELDRLEAKLEKARELLKETLLVCGGVCICEKIEDWLEASDD